MPLFQISRANWRKKTITTLQAPRKRPGHVRKTRQPCAPDNKKKKGKKYGNTPNELEGGEGRAISHRQKQKKLIMLPSETMIWQPEFTDKTLSRKPGAVQYALSVTLADNVQLSLQA